MNIKHFALAVLLLPLHGQESPNRFKKIPDLPKNPDDLPKVVVNHIEYFQVDNGQLHQWKARHPNEKITRDLVSDWLVQKQALAGESFFFSTRLDQRFTLHTGRLLTYPVEYTLPKFPGEWFIPSAFDQKLLGHSIDAVFSLDDRERLQAKLTFGNARLLGSDSHSAFIEEIRSPGDLLMPNFRTYRQLCGVSYPEGVSHLAGRVNSLKDETKALLVFSEAKSIALDPIPKNQRSGDDSKAITVSSEVIELPDELWIDYCRDKAPEQLRVNTATWARSLVQDQKATRLLELTKEAARGKKSDLYPKAKFSSQATSYKPTDPSKRLSPTNPLIPEDQVTGLKDIVLEVTPEITPSGHVMLSYVWQMHTPGKEYVIHRVSDGEQWIPDAWAPCPTFINQDGTVFVAPRENTLIGAFPVEGENDDPSNPKMRLFFFKAG